MGSGRITLCCKNMHSIEVHTFNADWFSHFLDGGDDKGITGYNTIAQNIYGEINFKLLLFM